MSIHALLDRAADAPAHPNRVRVEILARKMKCGIEIEGGLNNVGYSYVFRR